MQFVEHQFYHCIFIGRLRATYLIEELNYLGHMKCTILRVWSEKKNRADSSLFLIQREIEISNNILFEPPKT